MGDGEGLAKVWRRFETDKRQMEATTYGFSAKVGEGSRRRLAKVAKVAKVES